MRYILLLLVWSGAAHADPYAVRDAVREMFSGVPRVETVGEMAAHCGHDGQANPHIVYCTSEATIFVARGFDARPQAAFEMAQVLGHAMQVRHGVADVALREISRRRDEEAALRGMVTRQVACLGGVFLRAAGQPRPQIAALYGAEPFTGSYWGRNPLRGGPRVSIGTQARQEWLDIGFAAGDVSACSVGEMSADLLVAARR